MTAHVLWGLVAMGDKRAIPAGAPITEVLMFDSNECRQYVTVIVCIKMSSHLMDRQESAIDKV